MTHQASPASDLSLSNQTGPRAPLQVISGQGADPAKAALVAEADRLFRRRYGFAPLQNHALLEPAALERRVADLRQSLEMTDMHA